MWECDKNQVLLQLLLTIIYKEKHNSLQCSIIGTQLVCLKRHSKLRNQGQQRKMYIKKKGRIEGNNLIVLVDRMGPNMNIYIQYCANTQIIASYNSSFGNIYKDFLCHFDYLH